MRGQAGSLVMYLLCGAVCTWLLMENVNFQIRAEKQACLRKEAGVNPFTQGGQLGEGGSLEDQLRLGVRTRAGAIPLSQAGTSVCLEGEACLMWPVYWVPGVNDSLVCSGLHGRLGRGPRKETCGHPERSSSGRDKIISES